MIQPKTTDRPIRRIGDVMRPDRQPTGKEATAILDVQELAFRWELGQTTISEVRAATSGKQRWLATRFTPPDDPAFVPLMAMLDALVVAQTHFETKHGPFSTDDLHTYGAKVVREDGRELLCFPIRYPWKRRPNPEIGDPGERGEPIYRRKEERGPHLGSFGDASPHEYEPEWWEDEPR